MSMRGCFTTEERSSKRLANRKKGLSLILALAGLTGCQGFSFGNKSSKAATVTNQAVQANPPAISFGKTKVGSRQTQSETLSNPGSSAITITQAFISGTGFTLGSLTLPQTVPAGGSLSFEVAFTPTKLTATTGSVVVASDSASSSLSITLTGTGTSQAQPGQLSVSPASSFGNVPVGSSQSQTGTLSASGASVTLSSPPSVAPPFSVSGLSFPITIAAGNSANFVLTFSPEGSGTASENISFSSDASNSPTLLGVSGTGITSTQQGQLTATPPSVNFGSVAVGSSQTGTGTITASGASVTVSSASVSGPFAVSGISFPITIASGNSASFVLTFRPQASGAASGSVSFSSNATNSAVEALSGTGTVTQQQTSSAHGMFILNPPVNDNNCDSPYPPACFSQHLVPTVLCSGNGKPAGYNCTAAGPGQPYIRGAAFQVGWAAISPSNGTYSFQSPDARMRPWLDAGKVVSWVFEPTSFGTSNNATPDWYMATVPISSVSQSGGIITLQTTSPIGFLPGGVSSAAGLELQVTGTGTSLDGNRTASNPGIWTICDHNTAGCQDPIATQVSLIGGGADIAPVVGIGHVGNPVYGSSNGSTCTSGLVPIEWRPNFIKAWKDVIQHALAYYGSNNNVAYIRFGMGVGGQTNPVQGLSATDPNPVACQAEMTRFGFTPLAAPWPDPSSASWAQVQAKWVAFLKNMIQYEQTLQSPKPLLITLSPIQYSPDDLTTADAVASAAVAAGIGLGNQGLQKSDPLNFAANRPCFGGDWCYNFGRFKGLVPMELQTLNFSDPTNQTQMGSLAPNLLSFATSHNAQILELYLDDWMCTYDDSWRGDTTFGQCTSAGYTTVLSSAAAQIN
jgi:hypothetical protein